MVLPTGAVRAERLGALGARGIFAAMKKLLFLGTCLIALSASPVIAQTIAPAVAVVSIKYGGDGPAVGHLLINRDGKIERQDVLNVVLGEPLRIDEVLVARAKLLRRIVTQLYQEGYMLKASLGHTEVDELIFVKEK
jgi:hypothetical protein